MKNNEKINSLYKGDWIKLHRKLLDSIVFDNPKLLKFWLWCLLRANHKRTKIMIGFQEIYLNPGEFIFGRISASEELKMPLSSTRNCLAKLIKIGKLDIKTTNKFSIIKVKRWNVYQNDGHQNDNKRTADGQQMDTDKNDNNDKKNVNVVAQKNKFVDNLNNSQKSQLIYHLDKIKDLENIKAWHDVIRQIGFQSTVNILIDVSESNNANNKGACAMGLAKKAGYSKK